MSLPDLKRRQFVQFLGASAVVAAGHRLVPNWLVARAAEPTPRETPLLDALDFAPVPVSHADDVVLADGFAYEVLLRQGDVINPQGDRYGDYNDYLAIIQRDDRTGWLWVNHENVSMKFVAPPGLKDDTREWAEIRLKNVGGSCLRIERQTDGFWRPVLPHAENFRVDGWSTPLKLTGPATGTKWVNGAREAIGMVGNCGGGLTPWGTFCTAEENFHECWGDPEMKDAKPKFSRAVSRPSEHYGYICEIDPETGELFKHTALGRLAHENVAFTLARDGRLVAYLGDDRVGQFLYKFVSRQPYDPAAGKANRALLGDGILHAADTKRGRWLPLDPARQRWLRVKRFDAARICVHTRTAARLVGATPLARPEDVEVHPVTGEVYVALTSWQPSKAKAHRESYFPDIAGAIGRVREQNGDAGALRFAFDILVPGTKESGLAWPDNITITDAHHLLVATDFKVKPKPDQHSSQEAFGNNYLVVIPTNGPRAKQVIRFATGPHGAEFCAPTLTPDRRELWLNVQHPGEDTVKREEPTSHWPDGGNSLPRSAMVAIRRKT